LKVITEKKLSGLDLKKVYSNKSSAKDNSNILAKKKGRESIFTPNRRTIKNNDLRSINNRTVAKPKMFYPKSPPNESAVGSDDNKDKLKRPKRRGRIRLFSNQERIKKRMSKIGKESTINQITK